MTSSSVEMEGKGSESGTVYLFFTSFISIFNPYFERSMIIAVYLLRTTLVLFKVIVIMIQQSNTPIIFSLL